MVQKLDESRFLDLRKAKLSLVLGTKMLEIGEECKELYYMNIYKLYYTILYKYYIILYKDVKNYII